MLDFAVTMAKNVHKITEKTIARLHAAGASDLEILDTAQIAGFFSYYTRLVDALGIEREEFMKKLDRTAGS